MDRQRKKKIQNIRIMITNILMAISVIGIVFILMLIAMGYNFNENGGLEQSGLIQISSSPKGATVEIDNETQFGRTDISKMLSSGDHRVKISKDGYDSWERTIKVDAGLLTRIEWARLFPLKANTATVAQFSNLRLAEFSDNRKNLFVIEHDSPIASYINIQGDKINTQKFYLNKALGNDESVLDGTLKLIAWNESNDKALFTWTRDKKTTWHIFDLQNADKSVNLSKKYGMEFTDIRIANDSASKLWALEKGNMHIIDLSNQTISGVLIHDVEQFTNNKDVIAYVSTDEDGENRKISIFKEGEKGATPIVDLKDKKPNVILAMGAYWNESWLAYSIDKRIHVQSGTYPSYDKPSKDNLKEVVRRNLEFAPTIAGTNRLNRVVVFAGSCSLTSIDIETHNYFDSTTETELSELSWLDDYLLWENSDNKIIVRDFDGENRREILDVNNQHAVNITENDKWLYYFDAKQADVDADGQAKDKTNETASTEIVYQLKRQKLE